MLEKILKNITKEVMSVDYAFIENNEDKVYYIDLDEFLGDKVEHYPSYFYGATGTLVLYGWQLLDFIDHLGIETVHGVYCYI